MTGNEDGTTRQHERTDRGADADTAAARGTRRRGRFGGPARIATAAAAVLAAGVMVTGCGNDTSGDSASGKAGNTAADVSGHKESGTGGDGGSSDGGSSGGGSNGTSGGSAASDSGDGGTSGGSGGSTGGSQGGSTGGSHDKVHGQAGKSSAHYGSSTPGACTSADLTASIGPNHPGAGQENFALVFTNKSGKTCTVRGYPGFAFVDSEGDQVSYDPHRDGGTAKTVKLAPGKSAWASLSFTNPQMTNVPTVTPDSALLTPPDQRASLKVDWSGGPVTATGKASVPKIGTLSPGTGD